MAGCVAAARGGGAWRGCGAATAESARVSYHGCLNSTRLHVAQVPRGRYDIELFDKYLKLHGARAPQDPPARAAAHPHSHPTCAVCTRKTYDYKLLHTNLTALY